MNSYRPSGFGGFGAIPPATKNLVIINVLVFIGTIITPTTTDWVYRYLALYFPGSDLFIPTQYITSMFVHDTRSIFHLFFNMLALWMFGSMVETIWKAKRFFYFYMVCGIGAGIVYSIAMYIMNKPLFDTYGFSQAANYMRPAVGASGAIYGILVAYGFLYPNSYVNIYFIIPVKAKYFSWILIGISLFSGIRNDPNDNVAHFAHLGGALVALIWLNIGKLRRYKRF